MPTSDWKRFKKFLAASLAVALVSATPGLPVYTVMAQTIAGPVANTQLGGSIVAPLAVPNAAPLGTLPTQGPQGSFRIGLDSVLPGAGLLTPDVRTAAPGALRSAAPVRTQERSASQGGTSLSQPASKTASKSVRALAPAVSAPQARRIVSRKVAAVSQGVSQALEDVGAVSKARPLDAHSLGMTLQDILSGTNGRRSVQAAVSPRSLGLGSFDSVADRRFARPAGKDSISDAAAAYNSEHEEPAPPVEEEPAPTEHQSPLPARIFASLMAAAPIGLIALPLFTAGAFWASAGVALASLALMTMPFMSARTPKFLRRLPGAALMALGAFTAVNGFFLGAGIPMGVVVAVGGYGLFRFGGKDDKEYFDEEAVIAAFFGAIGAIAGAGLVAAAPAVFTAAWASWLPFLGGVSWLPYVATGLKWLSYPLAALLFMHLPGWVGEGIESAVTGLWKSLRAVGRVSGSIGRDTVIYERMETFSEAKLKLSVWNVFKIGALWIPMWLTEAAVWTIGFAASLAMGAVQAPFRFLWGAAHDLSRESRVNKFLASWNRFVFFNAQASKAEVYNRMVGWMMPWANSKSALKSIPAVLGMRAAQLLWTVYALAATPFLYVIGFFRAFTQTGMEYDPELHSPSSMRATHEDSPWEKPDVGRGGEVRDLIPPGIFAAMTAMVPMYFLGWPLLAGAMPFLGLNVATAAVASYLAMGASMVVLPLLPKSAPKWVRWIPGGLLTVLGLTTMTVAPWMMFNASALGFLTTNMFWMGAVAALSGLGFINHVNKLAQAGDDDRPYWADDIEYIGAFFGALGVVTGVGIAMLGLAGWVPTLFTVGAYLTSLLLLMHLPRYFWKGVDNAFRGLFVGMGGVADVLGIWRSRDDTRFYSNLRDHARYYMKGSLWKVVGNAAWLSVVWVPMGVVVLAEYLASFVLGLANGLVKVPVNWLWGAAYKISPDSRVTRFIAGLGRALNEWTTNSKDTVFVKLAKPFLKAMDSRHEASHWPALKAWGALLALRAEQLFWLFAVALPLPSLVFIPLLTPYLGGCALFQLYARLLPIFMMQAAGIAIATILTAAFNATGPKEKPGEGDEWRPDPDNPRSQR